MFIGAISSEWRNSVMNLSFVQTFMLDDIVTNQKKVMGEKVKPLLLYLKHNEIGITFIVTFIDIHTIIFFFICNGLTF